MSGLAQIMQNMGLKFREAIKTKIKILSIAKNQALKFLLVIYLIT